MAMTDTMDIDDRLMLGGEYVQREEFRGNYEAYAPRELWRHTLPQRCPYLGIMSLSRHRRR